MPWILRNFLLTGFLFFHTLPGIHFLIYTAAYIKSDVEGIEYFDAKVSLLRKWDAEIKKNGLKMEFKAPIICKTRNIEHSSSMMIGVKFEGKDKEAFIEKIEETARNFGPEWERSVHKRKEEIHIH